MRHQRPFAVFLKWLAYLYFGERFRFGRVKRRRCSTGARVESDERHSSGLPKKACRVCERVIQPVVENWESSLLKRRHFAPTEKKHVRQVLRLRSRAEPQSFMKPKEIVLLPATHETVACFHVKEDLVSNFLRHLESEGIEVTEPPQRQGNPEMPFVKVNVEEGIPEARLQQALDDFKDNR